MIPNKELQELAIALMRSSEYTEMMRLRKKALNNQMHGRHMLNFEREQARIYSQKLSESDTSARLKKLYSDYHDLFEKDDVQNFIKATQTYQKMVSQSVDYLNRYLDGHIGNKSY